LGLALFGVAEAASLTAMAIRLRRAKGDERQQINWFLYAGIIVISGITVVVVLGVPITIASCSAEWWFPLRSRSSSSSTACTTSTG